MSWVLAVGATVAVGGAVLSSEGDKKAAKDLEKKLGPSNFLKFKLLQARASAAGKLEQMVDLTTLYDTDERGESPTMKLYEKLIKMIESNDKGFIQKKKEFSITRKEKLTRRGGKQKNEQTLSSIFADNDLDK